MRFLDIFSAQHNCLVIGFMMGTEIFEFRPYLCPWQPFKDAIFGHSLEKKSDSELNFTPENTPHMSRLHIGNSQEGNKRSKNEQF